MPVFFSLWGNTAKLFGFFLDKLAVIYKQSLDEVFVISGIIKVEPMREQMVTTMYNNANNCGWTDSYAMQFL